MDLIELQEIGEAERSNRKRIRIHCCTSTGCQAASSLQIKERFDQAILDQGLQDEVQAISVGCMGFCGQGPMVEIDPDGVLYEKVTPDDAASIIAALHGGEASARKGDLKHPFFARQKLVVRQNGGRIDPERIEEYIAAGGYEALYHALHEMSPNQVIDEITRSGLRGRGGAGYPTGLKWGTVAKSSGTRKFVVCNGDEGDPGAFMDRSILESDPHLVLEGMAIAAYAVGASQGYIYVRGEYPLAIKRFELAIRQAKRHGILGSQVFDTGFSFQIDVRIGAGAFVCGEETALMASIEGRRGMPRPRPPFPAQSGLWGFPTLINNVETFGNIAPIIRNGAAWFASMGTEKSKGTKVFALTGTIRNTGLIEVPMGITLREIVEELGGGSPTGQPVKAVQTGGPSGGCIPTALFDTSVDYEALAQAGSIMGSGGMVVIGEDTNMVEMARFYMEFCRDESCGKCTPCRAGTVQLERLLNKILVGDATHKDIDSIRELSAMMKEASLCGLGQTAPNPVLATLHYFPQEYEALLRIPEREVYHDS